jgi:hypothetical protein
VIYAASAKMHYHCQGSFGMFIDYVNPLSGSTKGVNPGGTHPPSFLSGGGDEYLIIPPLFNMFNEVLFLGIYKPNAWCNISVFTY